MTSRLEAFAKERNIKYFLFNFTDLRGAQRSKLVPAAAVADMEQDGAGFAGFATWLDLSPANPDMFAVPDPDTVTQLPWKPEVAWVAGDLWMDGEPIEQAPRRVLKRMILAAQAEGFHPKSGVEAEFHLISQDGSEIQDPLDTAEKPCYDQSAVMRQYDVISEICDAMLELGWQPYQNDHEDSNGQFEMNWAFDDCLVTADRHVFFKFMVRSIAEKYGMRATFMPKPFMHLTGNGCHVHLSLWDEYGKTNMLDDHNDELGLSAKAYYFMGGVLHHAPAICAITNPTVNSYKRINAPVTASGATWSPNSITWAGNNRTHMIRVPDSGRFEFRQADGAANPYLLQAVKLAAGLEGIASQREPGKRLDIDMYSEGHKARGARRLPLYLIDAIRAFERNKALRAALGEDFSKAYIKLKLQEWDDYSRQLTEWERQQTLDC
ncbi:MAG: type III glutamate--ammonia ligase [Halofilum sp. (in: g-proteobacteria)]